MAGDLEAGLGGLGDEEAHLVGGVAVRLAIDTNLDDLGAVQDVAADGLHDLVVGVRVEVLGVDQALALGNWGELAAEAADDEAGVDDPGARDPALFDRDAE